MTLNEAKSRILHIDPQLRAADRKLNDRTQLRLEVPVDGYGAELRNRVTDHCLDDASSHVLAVVEAIHGVEKTDETGRLGRLNLAVRGLN